MAKPCRIFSPEEDVVPIAVIEEDDTNLCKNLVEEFSESEDKEKNRMVVFLRIRPFTATEKINDDLENCIEILPNKEEVVLKAPTCSATYRNNPYDTNRLISKFTFTRVFGPLCSQKEFFNAAIGKTVRNFLSGQNCLVFAYGATNSGKTYTVQGTPGFPGVIPSAIKVIFKSLEDHLLPKPEYKPFSSFEIEKLSPKEQVSHLEYKEKLIAGINIGTFYNSQESVNGLSPESINIFDTSSESCVSKITLSDEFVTDSEFLTYVSFAEIYNEQLFDLLRPCEDIKKRVKLNLFQDSKGFNHIKGLTKILVTSEEETQKLLTIGRRNLHIAATKLNDHSSRSHCIFTIYLIRVVKSSADLAYINKLSFCDLAGSERVVKTKNTGDRLKEAGSINTSLMVLGRCINVLRTNQYTKDKNLVPYRDSKLTQLFKSFFNGQGKASMIVNIAPNSSMFDDTLKALKFSALAKQVITKDQTEKSILNFTNSISERLTSFWVKSNRRWSSIAAANQKQSVGTIPEVENYVEMETVQECDDFDVSYGSDDDDDELDLQELLNDIKLWEEKAATLELRVKELERENASIKIKTKDEAAEFYENHIRKIEENHKEHLDKREQRFEIMLNKRTQLLENYISKLEAKNQEGCSDEESEDEESPDLIDKSMQVNKSTCEFGTSIMSTEEDEIANLKVYNEELEKKVEDLETRLLRTSEMLEAESKNNRLIFAQLEESQLKPNSVKMEIEKLHEEIGVLKQQAQIDPQKFEDLQKHKTCLENELRNLNIVNEGLIRSQEEKLQNILQLECDVREFKTKSQEQQKKISSLEIDLEKAQNLTTRESVKNRDKQEEEISQLKENLKDLQEELELRKEKVSHLEKEFDTTEQQNKERESIDTEKLQKLELEIFDYKDQVSKLEYKVSTITKELELKNKNINEKSVEFDKLTDIFLEKVSEINDLSEKLKEMEESREKRTIEFEQIISGKDSEIDELRGKLNQVEENARKYKMELDDIENFQHPRSTVPMGAKTRAKRTRVKKMKLDVNTSESSSESQNDKTTEVLVKLEASRSPLATLDAMLDGSPLYNSIKKTVEYSIEKVSNVFSKSTSEFPEQTASKRSSRRRLYTPKEELLSDAPNDEPSPIMPVKRNFKQYSLRRKPSKK